MALVYFSIDLGITAEAYTQSIPASPVADGWCLAHTIRTHVDVGYGALQAVLEALPVWRWRGQQGSGSGGSGGSGSGSGGGISGTGDAAGSAALPAGHADEEAATCAVCLDEYEYGCARKTLPCFCVYHAQCITHRLRLNPTCPCCRTPVVS